VPFNPLFKPPFRKYRSDEHFIPLTPAEMAVREARHKKSGRKYAPGKCRSKTAWVVADSGNFIVGHLSVFQADYLLNALNESLTRDFTCALCGRLKRNHLLIGNPLNKNGVSWFCRGTIQEDSLTGGIFTEKRLS
jgi:hypothetical protein